MRPIKRTIKIEVEVTPSEYWKKTRNGETEKMERISYSTKIAKALIKELENRIVSYASEQLDDEADIVFETCERAGVNNYDDEHYNSLVAGLKIQGIDQFCSHCQEFKNA